MMIVSRCLDAGTVRSIMTHPRIYPWVSDDGSPSAGEFEPLIHDSFYYLLVQDEKPIALFFYHPHNAITYEVHTCVLPEFYGETAKQAAKMSLRWMVDNTPAKKIITHVPENNPKAKRFAVRCGMTVEGMNRASFLKGGEILDQCVLGITEGEICQQR